MEFFEDVFWRLRSHCYLLAAILLFCQGAVVAQPPGSRDTILFERLDSVVVTAGRLESRQEEVPFALSIVDREQLQLARQQLSLQEGLAAVPGLFALNPDNFAQDLRLSIRGFGARAAFGIRGIKVLVDGLPESTPDGQGQVDNIDPGLLQQAEVIRGPSSGLYGNAAGGAIVLQTEEPPVAPLIETRASGGSYGFRKYQLKGGNQWRQWGLLAYGSHTRIGGFRDHSSMSSTLANIKLNYQIKAGSRLQLLLNFVDSPEAQDPGSLSREAVIEDRRQAWPANLRFDAGEAVSQGRVGLRWQHSWAESHQLEGSIFYLRRQFDNRLPFESGGIVQLGRQFYGGGASYGYRGKLARRPYRFQLGFRLEQQEDERQRFDNLAGELGAEVFSQQESFRNLGLYWVQEWQAGQRWQLSLSTRYDALFLEAADHFLQDGDDSGSIAYHRFNPSAGLLFTAFPVLRCYANVASSFETPALSELSANPEGGGFNTRLSPQRAINYELGVRGRMAGQFRYQLAVFTIDIRDELVPFELAGFPGRQFYRNAGRSRRRGLEASCSWLPFPGLDAQLAYTLSDFRYQDYSLPNGDYAGNRQPGIPQHFAFLRLQYAHPSGFRAALRTRYNGAIYADDANAEKQEAFFDASLQLSYEGQTGRWRWRPFLGINNLLDADYNNNLRINAFAGRYFEPAPPIHTYFGLRMRLE